MWLQRDAGITILNKALDLANLRQQTIADNIANADTPRYKRKDVSFAGLLAEERPKLTLNRTNSGHLPAAGDNINPQVYAVEDTQTRVDGNNVDVEVEMARMAANALYYDTNSQLLANRFRILSKIIEQGGRSL